MICLCMPVTDASNYALTIFTGAVIDYMRMHMLHKQVDGVSLHAWIHGSYNVGAYISGRSGFCYMLLLYLGLAHAGSPRTWLTTVIHELSASLAHPSPTSHAAINIELFQWGVAGQATVITRCPLRRKKKKNLPHAYQPFTATT